MTRGTWLALGAMAISVFVIANDVTALSVALPQIEKDFDADVSTVQWVINAYALVFGVLIVTGGRLAEADLPTVLHQVWCDADEMRRAMLGD